MNDLDDSIRGLRAEVREPTVAETAAARRAFADEVSGRSAPARRRAAWSGRLLGGPRRLAIPAAVLSAALVVAALALQIGGTPEATAVAIEDIAKLAARQSGQVESLAPGQFLLSRHTTVASITTTYDQRVLDALMARAATAREDSQPDRQFFVGTSPRRIERLRELESRRRREAARIDAAELPTRTVTVRYSSEYASWVDEAHRGGGGELPGGDIAYDSARQRRAASRLREAGIIDGLAELNQVTVASEIGRFDNFTWSSAEIRAMPTEPRALERELKSKPLPRPLVRVSRPVHDDEELFHVAIGILRSPFASPDLRAATVRMIGAIPGVETADRAEDARARAGFGVTLTTVPTRPQLVVDREDASVLGVNYRIDEPSKLKTEGLRVLPFADGARVSTSFVPALVVEGEPVCRDRAPDGREISRYCPWKIRPVR